MIQVSAQRITSLNDREVKEYEVYKLIILFFALIDQLYVQVFSAVTVGFVTFFQPLVEPLARIIRLCDSFITYDVLVTLSTQRKSKYFQSKNLYVREGAE